MRQGYGELTIKDVYTYKGEFYNDKINGNGRCEWFKKKVYQGSWKDNNMNGCTINKIYIFFGKIFDNI